MSASTKQFCIALFALVGGLERMKVIEPLAHVLRPLFAEQYAHAATLLFWITIPIVGIERAASKYLGAIEIEARAAGVPCEAVHVTNDFPADAILATAKRRKCDLIFMAAHGRHGLSAVLLGSETQKVLTHSNVSVVVYR